MAVFLVALTASLSSAASAFIPQPPVGRQAAQGVNPQNLTQTYFFAAQSNTFTNGIPDLFQLSFQIGSFFGPPFAPSEYFVVVSGGKAGVPFSQYVLAPNDTISTTDYSGNWGLASYEGFFNWESVIAKVDSPAQKASGSLTLKHSTGPPAWGCGPGTGTNLETLITKSSTPAEIDMYKNTNWAHFALGQAEVKANINGTILDFKGGFEAETSYGPPYEQTYSRFIYSFTTVGPYDIAFWSVAPPGEPNAFATIGYLAKHGRLLVNECNRLCQRTKDMTTITRTGSRNVTGLPFLAPQGVDIDFVDKHGRQYKFAFDTTQAQGSTFPIGSYTNALGKATGGLVNGKQYTGSAEVQYFVTKGYDLS